MAPGIRTSKATETARRTSADAIGRPAPHGHRRRLHHPTRRRPGRITRQLNEREFGPHQVDAGAVPGDPCRHLHFFLGVPAHDQRDAGRECLLHTTHPAVGHQHGYQAGQ